MVETNAVFSRDSIRPIEAGAVPENIKDLLMPHIKNHELTYKAARTFDKELVVEAFMNDPLVKGKNCKEADIRVLVDDMIDATVKYLPDGWKK